MSNFNSTTTSKNVISKEYRKEKTRSLLEGVIDTIIAISFLVFTISITTLVALLLGNTSDYSLIIPTVIICIVSYIAARLLNLLGASDYIIKIQNSFLLYTPYGRKTFPQLQLPCRINYEHFKIILCDGNEKITIRYYSDLEKKELMEFLKDVVN